MLPRSLSFTPTGSELQLSPVIIQYRGMTVYKQKYNIKTSIVNTIIRAVNRPPSDVYICALC